MAFRQREAVGIPLVEYSFRQEKVHIETDLLARQNERLNFEMILSDRIKATILIMLNLGHDNLVFPKCTKQIKFTI